MKNYLVKTVLTGDYGSGKSSILLRYTDNTFTDDACPTIGVDFRLKHVYIDDVDFKLQLWDTAGQEQYISITKAYFRSVYLFLIVFDITNRQSFINLHKWIKMIKENTDQQKKLVLIGNCIDLKYKREVSEDEALIFANYYKIKYYEVSAKKNINIDYMFNDILKDVLANIDNITLEGGIIERKSIPIVYNNLESSASNKIKLIGNDSFGKNCCSNF